MSDDEFRNIDLRGFDLNQLDLDHIELEEEAAPSPVWRWLFGSLLAGAAVGLLWLPRSDLYPSLGSFSFFFSFAGIAVGLLAGRFLWTVLDDMRERFVDRTPRFEAEPEGPPSGFARFLNGLFIIGGAGGIIYATQNGLIGSSGNTWFFAALGAVVVGIAFGRFLTMQAQVVDPLAEERKPVELPPWFKWVTLTLLIGGAVAVALSQRILPANEELSLALSAGGFILGITAAIWLSRRFEEAEVQLRERARATRRREGRDRRVG